MRLAALSALTVLAILTASTSEAKEKFYRWVDASGTVHYSKDAPANEATSEVEVSGATKPNPAEEAAPTEEAAPVESADAQLDAADAAICARAQSSLRVLETERPVVRRMHDTGERRVLSADEIAAELVIARKEVERTCAPTKAPTE